MVGPMVLPGSQSGAHMREGCPGTWETSLSPPESEPPPGSGGDQDHADVSTRGRASERRAPESEEPEAEGNRGGIRSTAGAQQELGKGEEESERPIVPVKPGNPTQGDSVEGRENPRGGARTQNRRRERWLADQRQEPSLRNKRG